VRTTDFDYELPSELIAQQPAAERDQSRMMVLRRREGKLEHRVFSDLPEYLRAGDLLVANDTQVIPARFYARKASGGKVEFLLLEEVTPGVWDVLMHASRRPKIGTMLRLERDSGTLTVLADGDKGRARVSIDSPRPLLDLLGDIGVPPLPPYILRKKADAAQLAADRERYQTVFARIPGAVAAPTAGLHFTPAVLEQLKQKSVEQVFITLHVGLGTFRPVETDRVEDHKMEVERYTIPAETAVAIASTRARGGRVIAVGSTTVRTLETVAADHGKVEACSGRSSLFIYPPYEFKTVDAMLTNFHLPKSTLLMMVSALAGRDFVMSAYAEAVKAHYRFYSYGDCMLIL